MNDFKAFENDTQSVTVGPGEGLTFENSTETIIVYGNLELNKETDPKEIENLIKILTTIKNAIK